MDVYDMNTEASIAVMEMTNERLLDNQYDREALIEAMAIKESCSTPQAVFDLNNAIQEIMAGGDPITYH